MGLGGFGRRLHSVGQFVMVGLIGLAMGMAVVEAGMVGWLVYGMVWRLRGCVEAGVCC